MVVNRAIVRDLFPISETANVFSKLILVMGVAPIIAPTIGGYVVAAWGWQSVFWVLAIIGIMVLISVTLFLPESRARDNTVTLRLWPVMKSYASALSNSSFIPFAIAGSMNTGGIFALITGASFVYMDLLHLDVKTFGLVFGFNAACFIIGSQVNRIFLRFSSTVKISLVVVIFQLSTILVLLLLVAQNWISLIVFITFFGLYTFCLGVIGPNVLALAMQPFTENVGVASAAYGSLRMAAGAITSALVSFFMYKSAFPMILVMASATMVGFLSLWHGIRMMRKLKLSTLIYPID